MRISYSTLFRKSLPTALLLSLAVGASANAQIAKKGRGDAELSVAIHDKHDGSHFRELFIQEIINGKKEKKLRKLSFANGSAPAGLKSGDRVRLRNAKVDKKTGNVRVGAGSGDFELLSSAAPVATEGLRSVLVLKVNTTNGSPGCSLSQLNDVMTVASNVTKESSYNKLYYSPIQTGEVSINYDATSCDYNQVTSLANSAYGSTINNFNHVVYVFAGNCSSIAWAFFNSNRAYVRADYCGGAAVSDLYVHELGHNLGMHHASTDGNNDGIVDNEYGDMSCQMGYSGVGARHFNGAHTAQLGWANAINATSGTYTLNALEASDTNSVLKVTPSSGAPYYVSYRAPIGNYSYNLPGGDHYRAEVVRYAGGTNKTLKITTLGNGQSFTDAVSGVTITQVSSNSSSANIQISQACTANAPSITLSPSIGLSGGGAVSYTATVKNNDGSGCASSSTINLAFASVVPGALSGSLDSSSINLAPGAQAQTILTVAAGSAVASGDNAFSLVASAAGHPSGSVTGTFRYDNVAPSVPSNFTASGKKQAQKYNVTLKWGASSDNSGGISYLVFRKAPNSSTFSQIVEVNVLTFKDVLTSANPNGQYSYYVVAKDSVGNLSGQSVIKTVTKN